MRKNIFTVSLPVIVFYLASAISACSNTTININEQDKKITLNYTVSMPDPSSHQFHVELNCSGMEMDTISFKMPEWMPGYYQIMDYSDAVTDFVAMNSKNAEEVVVEIQNDHTWKTYIDKGEAFRISYHVKADKKFVASSYVDSTHAYIVPPSMFMYIDKQLDIPVTVEIKLNSLWSDVATGLENIAGENNRYYAPDFDILYDCPILIGNLESLKPFYVDGIEHQFIGYELGDFDKQMFMDDLEKIVKIATDIIGEIPYKNYKFIAVGPRLGGIEHLNNTTVSFNGNTLNNKRSFNRMMSFLAHEYFHHYNVKRIRPYELGPFDYDKENKTNLLWVSEGLSVYYEYLINKRAGIINEQELFSNFEREINTLENDPGRHYQSLVESSFYTWEEGPFGNSKGGEDKSVSYYIKGPVVGLILDFDVIR